MSIKRSNITKYLKNWPNLIENVKFYQIFDHVWPFLIDFDQFLIKFNHFWYILNGSIKSEPDLFGFIATSKKREENEVGASFKICLSLPEG